MTDDYFSLTKMTWEQVQKMVQSSDPVVLLPAGSVEQHGRHLPLGTDTFTACDVARRAGCRVEDVVVAPPLWYGMSDHHMGLAGTVTIRPEVLTELVYDIVASLADHGFDKFVLINGHRVANLPWMQLVCGRVHSTLPDCRAVLFDLAYMSQSISQELDFEHLGHADEIETSHMLAAYPGLCRMDRAVDNPAPRQRFDRPDPRYEGDSLVYVPGRPDEPEGEPKNGGGVRGQPTRADADRGKQYRCHLVRRLVEVVEMMRSDAEEA